MLKLFAAFLLLTFAAVPAAAETAVERHGQLRVDGNRIVDKNGDSVVLRGMSLFWSQWQPEFYNERAIRWLRDDWNLNVIRAAVAVHQGGYMKNPAAETRRAEAAIDAAIKLGIYVLVDWHAHHPEPKAAGAFFTHIARKYGRHPNIIYETFNEPLRDQDWSTVIKPYHMAVIPKIRAEDPDGLVVAGTQTWSQDVDKAAADPLPFGNVAYTLHFYAGTHQQELRDKATVALNKGVALFVTEYGSTDANGDGPVYEEETARWFAFMEGNQLSYLNWSVSIKPESSAALLKGASFKGGWPERVISKSGRLVRDQLRRMNPPQSAPESAKADPCAGTC
ncbi:MAG TPA: glycoside hydrolase family 5 protein [Allosphingosinicella sp.]|jgi:endoglucanase